MGLCLYFYEQFIALIRQFLHICMPCLRIAVQQHVAK
jgi:hypothetical protein